MPSSTQPAHGQRSRMRAEGTVASGPPGQRIRSSPAGVRSMASGGSECCFWKEMRSRSPMAVPWMSPCACAVKPTA